MIFLVGQQQTKGRTVTQDIVKEAEEHNDLVQEDFIDTFVNLTVKATFMFKWYVITQFFEIFQQVPLAFLSTPGPRTTLP